MEQLLPFLPIVCLALIICVVVQFILISGLNARFTRQTKMLRQFFSGPQGEDLEGLLERTLSASETALANSQTALQSAQEDAQKQAAYIQRFALSRYNAFEDVTGEQSFSLVLLDGQNNGTVITSLLGRQNSRCFGKAIAGGQPLQPLSQEEQRVFLMACQAKNQVNISPPSTPSTPQTSNVINTEQRATKPRSKSNTQPALEGSGK